MKILFIGDIVGQIGRAGLALALPQLRERHQPDVIVANVENLAHGKGVTAKTLDEVKRLGVDVLTGGNHSFAKEVASESFDPARWSMVTPANDSRTPPGGGWISVAVGKQKLLVVNVSGQLSLHAPAGVELTSPFAAMDEALASQAAGRFDAVLVDHHAELTSEKVALGFYLDGRVSAVVGTHTHVPTADERVLPGGTAYVTDVGMCGPTDSVLGVKKEIIIDRFTRGGRMVFDHPESGEVRVGAVAIDVGPGGRAKSIVRADVTVAVG